MNSRTAARGRGPLRDDSGRRPCAGRRPETGTGGECVDATPPICRRDEKPCTIPAGFEIQLVAAEPEIHKPLNLAFDDRGRLWVTDTVEYPYPAKEGTKPRDTVKILANFGPDGKRDRSRRLRTD